MTIIVPDWFIWILIVFLILEVAMGATRIWIEYQLRKPKRRRKAPAATTA